MIVSSVYARLKAGHFKVVLLKRTPSLKPVLSFLYRWLAMSSCIPTFGSLSILGSGE
ncbi:hypothetical protein TRICHSKD4_6247 [Roseibium sp. TrichSKD4]|nr:hypothetical protein TRICHSKD4_6247 [Roseibium sp. TrichSKD4]